MSGPSSDSLMPTALTDFVFDLFQSVTASQIPEEQSKLYETDFRELSQKYFSSQSWPSPQSIAGECNGDPLFLVVYGELTHRHWHAVHRPTIRDRLEGWQVYRELFEELLDTSSRFYLIPSWVWDILNEFVYQFQGVCQVRAAVFASGVKAGLLDPQTGQRTETAATTTHMTNVLENWNILEQSEGAWDAQAVFGYLHRFAQRGLWNLGASEPPPPVYTYLGVFATVARSRLECLLGDYTACIQVLAPLSRHASYVIPKDMEGLEDGSQKRATVQEVLTLSARTSMSYHAGVSLLMLRRYKDATSALSSICAVLQRGFKTGQLRKLPSSEQFGKQLDRMISLLALLQYICPAGVVEDSVLRVVREKHGSKLEVATSLEEWFQSPKFIAVNPVAGNAHQRQLQIFLQEMASVKSEKTLRSFLKLYASLPVEKLAHFHDESVTEFVPRLLSYKLRMKQLTRNNTDDDCNYMEDAEYKTALDVHYYLEGETVYVDEPEKPRRFENYFLAQIKQGLDIGKEAANIDTRL